MAVPTGEAAAPGVAAAPEILQQVVTESAFSQCPAFTIPADPQRRLIAYTDEHGMAAERVRILSIKLRQMRQKRRLSRLLITSCVKGEGKTILAANLAVTLAKQANNRTLIIDADLRRACLSDLLGTVREPGIADWWQRDLRPEQLLRQAEGFPLFFLPAGRLTQHALEILQSQRFSDLVAQLSAAFEWVIIDSPPFAPLADSNALAALSDGALFVVRQNYTPTRVLRATMDSFDAHKLIGFVVNECSSTGVRYHDHYYYYGSKDGGRQQ